MPSTLSRRVPDSREVERVLPSSLWLLGERHKRHHEEPGRLIERQPPEDWLVVTFAIARLWWRLREHLQLSTSLA